MNLLLPNDWQATPGQQHMADVDYSYSNEAAAAGFKVAAANGISGGSHHNISTNLYDQQQQHQNLSAFYLPDGDNLSYCQNFDGNLTYLNVSCESNLPFSIILYGYFTPFLLLVTLIANSLIVVVLSRRNMASPTNSVLMGE